MTKSFTVKLPLTRIQDTGISPEALNILVDREAILYQIHLVACQRLGFSDLGLNPNTFYRQEELELLGVDPTNYQHAFNDSLEQFRRKDNRTEELLRGYYLEPS